MVHLLTPTAAPDTPVEGDRDAAMAIPPRVGLVVSKAVGNAVIRNLVKRRLRHLVREHIASLPGRSMLVVRAQPPAAATSYAELGAELDRCLGRCLEGVGPR